MPVKMRLARHGKKNSPFYFIVVADSKAPRDGRYVERIGSYNPNTFPTSIDLNFERALYWLQTGAQPTDTVRSILSDEGVLLKDHLMRGVKKGAFNEEQMEVKFQKWISERDAKIQAEVDKLGADAAAKAKARIAAESEVNKARAAAIAKRKADATAALVAEIAAPAEDASEEA
jgi:small subunit ribosomal protein S16